MHTIVEQRLGRLRQQLSYSEVDTLLVFSGENRRYLSGFTAENGADGESAGVLLITSDRQILATDSRYEIQARQEAGKYEVICYRSGLAESLPELVSELGSCRLGLEAGHVSYAGFKKMAQKVENAGLAVAWVDADDLLADLRSCKDQGELTIIKKALELAETVFIEFLETEVKPGLSEKEAAWRLEKQMREAGAEALAFPVIAAFGDNSAMPHAIPGARRLEAGQPILFDWGARVEGYCSDISRSFTVGAADGFYRRVHRTVYEAQQRAIAAIRPGISAREVDAVARDYIEQAGFKGKFGHGLGHGVGLAIHESPRVGATSEAVLEEGMVFTVEPGIYLPQWGGVRLENMVVVRAEGAEVLNGIAAGFRERT